MAEQKKDPFQMGATPKGIIESVQEGVNLIKQRADMKSRISSYKKKAQDIVKKQQYEEHRIRKASNEEKGDAMAKAGASGVKVSSFDDAFTDHSVKTEQEAAMMRYQANRELEEISKDIKSERRADKARSANYMLGCLSSLF